MEKPDRQPKEKRISQPLSDDFANNNASVNELKLQLVFEHAPIGLMYFDQKGVITSCNEALAKMMGLPREALSG